MSQLDQDDILLTLLEDCLRLMRKCGGFIQCAPIFERLEKAIKKEEEKKLI